MKLLFPSYRSGEWLTLDRNRFFEVFFQVILTSFSSLISVESEEILLIWDFKNKHLKRTFGCPNFVLWKSWEQSWGDFWRKKFMNQILKSSEWRNVKFIIFIIRRLIINAFRKDSRDSAIKNFSHTFSLFKEFICLCKIVKKSQIYAREKISKYL